MPNPLYHGGAENFTNPLMQRIQSVIQMVKGQPNPEILIQQLERQNPQAAQMLNQMRQNGQSPKDVVMGILKSQGINPEDIMKQLK